MLYNYVGEVDRRATYFVSYLSNVKCIIHTGASPSSQGRGERDSATLYIFDRSVIATDASGNELRYIPYDQWACTDDKSGCWTLSPDGDDYFFIADQECATKAGIAKSGESFASTGRAAHLPSKRFKINGFSRLKQGSPRMWHFKVVGG